MTERAGVGIAPGEVDPPDLHSTLSVMLQSGIVDRRRNAALRGVLVVICIGSM